MIDSWLHAIDNGQMIGVVLVDFKKAFDLVDHQIFLSKLEIYGIKDDALQWFKTYLTQRKQQVYVNNSKSDIGQVSYGVPQGSILGPLLFLLFINDLPLYVNNVNTDLYADDTTLYDIQNSVEDIENNLQIALDRLNTWCKCNGMLLNSSKTKIMLVTTNQKRQRLDKEILDLKFNEESLSMISNDKILGVFVDQNLTWSDHIRHLSKKITSSIWLLWKVKKFLSQEHRILFYKLNMIQIIYDPNSSTRLKNIKRHETELKWIKFLQSPFPLGFNDNIYHEGNISKMPDFDVFSVLEYKKRKSRSHGKRKNGNIKRKICTEKRLNTSLKDLSLALTNHGRHGLFSFLSSLPISVLRNLELEANKLYDRANKLYKAALLTRCYVQHFLSPYIDSEVNHKRHFIKIPFINKGIEFIDLHSIFKDNSVISSIPSYFNNSETPIICYKYNKPIRSTIFNFNKIVNDLDIDSNTPAS